MRKPVSGLYSHGRARSRCPKDRMSTKTFRRRRFNLPFPFIALIVLPCGATVLAQTNSTRAKVVPAGQAIEGARLGEINTVLLADFDNNTGEGIFDDALRQALAIELEQSPLL